MAESHEIRTARYMAWERAKGELNSMRCTFYANEEQFDKLSFEIKKFIQKVEEDGLQE